MRSRKNKKVIIITSIMLILMAIITLIFTYNHNKEPVYNLDQQNLATKTITLPNGSIVTAEFSTPEASSAHAWIGANLTSLTSAIRQHLNFSDTAGIYVQDTLRDSPAQLAGILPGDIIIKINNIETQEVMSTLNLIAALSPGAAYPFTIYRHGKYVDYLVTVDHKKHVS